MKRTRKASFTFTGKLAPIEAAFMSTAVFIPRQILDQLPAGRVRVKGTMNGAPFSLAVQHKKNEGWYFSVSNALRKAAHISVGDPVTVSFKLVDPEKVEVPEELEAVLAQDDEAMEVWKQITPGMQRSLIHYVTSVKNVDSRISRALFLVNKAKTGAYTTQRKKAAKEK